MKIVIYIPGLGYNLTDVSLDAYCERLLKALDENDPVSAHRYTMEPGKTKYGNDLLQTADHCSIQQINGKDNPVLFKVYEFSYGKLLTSLYDDRNIFVKSGLLLMALLKSIPMIFYSLFKRAKGLNQNQIIQSLYFFLIVLMVGSFGLLVLPSLITVILELFANKQLNAFFGRYALNLQHITGALQRVSYFIISLTSVVLIFAPKFQQIISVGASNYLCANYYLSIGAQHQKIQGRLTALLETIVQENRNAEQVDIHAYSFGSVIAIDALFPASGEVSVRMKQEVKRLVTIGCPYDFLRFYYPHYFVDRKDAGLQLQQWYNVNCEVDILSSNFRNDSQQIHSDPALTPGNRTIENITYHVIDKANVSILDHFFLIGFKAHRMYWDKDPDGSSFLNVLIPRLNIYPAL